MYTYNRSESTQCTPTPDQSQLNSYNNRSESTHYTPTTDQSQLNVHLQQSQLYVH